MRILTVCSSLTQGGTQRVAQNFTLGYQRLGHEVAFLAYNEDGVRRAALDAAGIPVFVGHDAAAFAALEKFAPQALHIHRPGMADGFETNLMRQLKLGSNSRRVLVETNVFGRVDYSRGDSLVDVHFHLTRWCFWKWRRCEGWAFGWPSPPPAAVVPNAVESHDFPEVTADDRARFRAMFDLPADAYVCGQIGRATISNWNEVTFDAFQRLASVCPNAYLLLRGLPEVLKPRLDALPAEARSRVRLLPMTNSDAELRQLYGALDCYLHAALLGESFGMALTEAMLCGAPVVTAARPAKGNSQVEVVRHRIDGLVAGSFLHFSEAVEQMWRDSAFRQQASRTVRQSIIDRFDTDLAAARAVRIMEHALAAKNRKELKQKLRDDPTLITSVSDDEIRQMLSNTVGGPDPRETRRMWLLHHPLTNRAAQTYLRLTFYRQLRKAKKSPAQSKKT